MPSRFFVFLLGIIALCSGPLAAPAAETGAAVGSVTRLQGEASAQVSGQTRALKQDAAIDIGDRLTTGPDARLEVKFTDGTTLTLGEKADFTVDDLSVGEDSGLALFTRKAGAMLLSGGGIAKLPTHKIEVANNAGTIGIRGTTVWGGVVKDGSVLDVFLVEGAIEVRTPAGTVLLDKVGQGTSVHAIGGQPDQPGQWADALRDRALATVAFTAP